ncbi:hypothetical protein Fcan01_16323 [Folsomia candida]|uniref:Uncharacterized protein n=1 Tax=Folsomia candida TaxID=158441 RepID=A0A226DTX5_FOLCA|nr:hypothetical protein Fcan01_16323 [Folsomia candida]
MKPVALSISLVFLLLGISGQVKSSATSQPQPDAVNPGTNGEIAFKGKCSPTDKCKYANVSCIDGICQCKQGQFFTALMRDQQGCFDIVQIHNIATVEDHPRVIINQTCLQSPERNNSCRSPCYTGLLVDVIRMIDNEIKNLENCTVTEMDSVGTLDTSSDPPSWNTGLMAIVAKKNHPWVIKNETCLQVSDSNISCRCPCYTGFLIDVIRIIDNAIKNLENCTITEKDSIGTLDTSTDPPSWNNGLMQVVAKNQTDLVLAPFSLTKQTTELRNTMDFSTFIISNPYQQLHFSIGFPLSSRAEFQYLKW